MLRLMMGALLMACCTLGTAYAVDIYQWKDAGGITHFTDNGMNVPEKYRKTAKRKVNKLQISGGNEQSKGGATAWLAKCASCHTTGESKGDKSGLGALAVNQKSKFPATIEEIVPQLRRAANGRMSDMPSLDVTDKELKQIATFILGAK